MVSPTTAQPEASITVAALSNGDLVKITASKRSLVTDQQHFIKTTNGSNNLEEPKRDVQTQTANISSSFRASKVSNESNSTNFINGTNGRDSKETDSSDSIIEDLSSQEQDNEQALTADAKETQPPKKTLPQPAPIPTVNVWQVRKEAMIGKKIPEITHTNEKQKEVVIEPKKVPVETSINIEADPLEVKRFPKKSIKKPKLPPILPPLEDESSWPAPAEVLIKDREKEATELSERKQSVDLSKKEDTSPKRGKGKWIPYTPIITHSTPLPTHGPKHRRRSEDSVPLPANRERRPNEKTPNNDSETSILHQNGNSNPRRRASVPPPNGREQYARRYSQSAENGQFGHHAHNPPFRGGRRGGRGRPFTGNRGPPRSATFSYSPNFSQPFGSLFSAKFPYVYDMELLKYYILQQIEYYFSIENLCKDIYLRSNMDPYGFVDIALLANFNRVKLLTLDENLVREALLNSYVIEVSGDKARKRDGWEMWLLTNKHNAEQALMDSNLIESSASIQEYEDEYEDGEAISDYIDTIDDENKENEELTGQC
ncbi:hypothetical protein G9A89_015595 [Geosiphon pyriformis]|nr:hypothetical protein G9A89_015595 [Geosiphon pyriformis]